MYRESSCITSWACWKVCFGHFQLYNIKCDAVSFARFPEKAVSVLQSGCLESLLLRSLYTDREFWESRGGVSGLRPLIRTVEHRGKILLQHIRDKKLRLKRDLWMSRLNKAGIITTHLIHHTEHQRDGSMTRCSLRGCACRETLQDILI